MTNEPKNPRNKKALESEPGNGPTDSQSSDSIPGFFYSSDDEEMHRGYVKFWRKLQSQSLWLSEKFTRGQAWVDLIALANHKKGHIRIRGRRVDIDRGQLGYSELTLAKRWKWSRGKVRRFLAELESEMEHKIVQQKTNLTTLITIINYPRYQGDGTPHSTADGHQTVQQTDTKRYTNKNDNNVKNDKNKYLECVFLKNEEHKKLVAIGGQKITELAIEILNNYKMANGKKYKSDYHAIINWAMEKARLKGGPGPMQDICKSCGKPSDKIISGICFDCDSKEKEIDDVLQTWGKE